MKSVKTTSIYIYYFFSHNNKLIYKHHGQHIKCVKIPDILLICPLPPEIPDISLMSWNSSHAELLRTAIVTYPSYGLNNRAQQLFSFGLQSVQKLKVWRRKLELFHYRSKKVNSQIIKGFMESQGHLHPERIQHLKKEREKKSHLKIFTFFNKNPVSCTSRSLQYSTKHLEKI